jgi:hypothetical protein
MPRSPTHLAAQLNRLAQGAAAGDRLAVGRVQAAGEPHGWYESISYERGGLVRYLRSRSQADEGGAPIGVWQAPADDASAQALASALCAVQAWNVPSATDLPPGAEVVNWSCVTSDAILDLVVGGGSPVLQAFAPLDLVLRRLANGLVEGSAGASLRVALQAKVVGAAAVVRVALINDGHQRAVLVNPLVDEPTDADHFRLEIAPLPPSVPNETGYGAVFAPCPVSLLPPQVDPPWDEPYLVLDAASRLLLPHAPSVPLPGPGRYLLRAVYSNQGLLDQVAGLTVIRGRAFSNEVVVEP